MRAVTDPATNLQGSLLAEADRLLRHHCFLQRRDRAAHPTLVT